jgi:hypothetical protein
MRRQLPPSHLKVPPGPHAFPRQQFLGQDTVVVNHYSGIEKAIPAIPSLPGFRTSAGMSKFTFHWPLPCHGRVLGCCPGEEPTKNTTMQVAIG